MPSRHQGIQNPFLRDWEDNFFKDERKRIASIAFIRALIEHVGGDQDTRRNRNRELQ
jgi:hypothetical protein